MTQIPENNSPHSQEQNGVFQENAGPIHEKPEVDPADSGQMKTSFRQQILALLFTILAVCIPLGVAGWLLFSYSVREIRVLEGPANLVMAVSFSPDGKLAAAGGADRIIWIWDIQSGKILHRLKKHELDVNSLDFSPDCKYLASAGFDTVHLWKVDTGEYLRQIPVPTNFVLCVKFSPDGKYLATTSRADQFIRIWEIETGKQINLLIGHKGPVQSLAFSPQGRLASAGDNCIRLWEIPSGNKTMEIAANDAFVNCVLFSKNGDQVISGNRNGIIQVWNVCGSEPIEMKTLVGHKTPVICMAVSADGNYLASGSLDQLPTRPESKVAPPMDRRPFRFWSLQMGSEAYLIDVDYTVWSLAISPDGKSMLSGGADGKVHLWQIP